MSHAASIKLTTTQTADPATAVSNSTSADVSSETVLEINLFTCLLGELASQLGVLGVGGALEQLYHLLKILSDSQGCVRVLDVVALMEEEWMRNSMSDGSMYSISTIVSHLPIIILIFTS